MKRFSALVAALMLSFALAVPAFAASDTEADMPSLSDFKSHYGSWFVWRRTSAFGTDAFELLCDPISVSGSSYSLGNSHTYSSSPFQVNYIADSNGANYFYACVFPVPLRGTTGLWSDLPSFPVGSSLSTYCGALRVYSNGRLSSSVYLSLASAYSSSDHFISFGNSSTSSSGSSTDTFSSFTFSSPFYSYPFAFRQTTPTTSSGFALFGGLNDVVVPPSDFLSSSTLSLSSTRVLVGTSSFNSYPYGFTIPSSSLGLVIVSKPSGSFITDVSLFAAKSNLSFSLLVPSRFLHDVKVGDWLSDSPEDLQKALTNEFGIDSSTLKDSKDNLNSWNSTSSVDSDVSSTASGLLGGVFQNLGTFLFSVSLLCFGAVVIRMLIKKAVS